MNSGYCCKDLAAGVLACEFDRDDEGRWRVVGCCGNCYVAHPLKYCPYCGVALAKRKH